MLYHFLLMVSTKTQLFSFFKNFRGTGERNSFSFRANGTLENLYVLLKLLIKGDVLKCLGSDLSERHCNPYVR